MGKVIECKFNIFNEGRTYTGHHRSYLLENARKVIESPVTQEKIKLREAVGYYGHGWRKLAGKNKLAEVEAVKLPNGETVVISCIPSNVTTQLTIADDGTVTHIQEVLESDTGKIVESLHNSKVGGFSWACGGSDGGEHRATRLSSFAGMDYVLAPGFAMNRGYVFESASGEEGDGVSSDMILESIAKATGWDDSKAESMLKGWMADTYFQVEDLQERLENAEIYESALLAKMEEREGVILDLESQIGGFGKQAEAAIEAELVAKKAKEEMVNFITDSASFFIPEAVKHAMMENDFEKAKVLFSKARQVDISSLPINHNMLAPKDVKKDSDSDGKPKYGTAAAGWEL